MDALAKIAPPNPDEMEQLIKAMRPGQSLIYHTGFLHDDRQYDVAISRRADIAWKAKERGLAFLFQRRALNGCDYILVRRRGKQ